MQNKINVFLVGAQKAGTTSLYDWLGQHHEICAPQEIKDYHFFTNEDIYKNGISNLEQFYRDGKVFAVHGAVNYLYFYQKAARRIYDYNPNAKIIICLREPVARAISAYMYCVKTLREEKSLSDALSAELNGKLSTFKQLSDNTYIEHGKYVEQIQGFREFFPDEQIEIIFFEDLVDIDRRKSTMAEVLRFIGLDDEYKFEFTHLNKSGTPRSEVLNYILRKSSLKNIVKAFLPRSLRKRIGNSLNELNTSAQMVTVDVTEDDAEILKRHLGKVGIDLQKKLGIDVSRTWS
jgi:hypothetical protein